MSYTLSGIRNRILDDKLDDDGFDPGVIDNFINDSQREVFNSYELPFAERTFLGSLSQGNYIFQLPSDYQLAQSLVIVDPSNRIVDITDKYIPFRDFNSRFPKPDNNTAGVPQFWTLHGDKLYFDRPTDQAYQMTLFYIKTPDTLEDDADVPELPSEFEEVLVLGGFYRSLERNEDYDLAASVKQDYRSLMDSMAQRLGKRHTGTPTVIPQPLRAGSVRSRRRP